MSYALRVPIRYPDRLEPVLTHRCRFKIVHGGRGSAKSHTIAQFLLAKGAEGPLRILCVREVQKSIAESSMAVLKHYIKKYKLTEYVAGKTEIRNIRNGTVIHFTGLKDHTSDTIKSLEGYDIVWVEEAHSVTAESWNKLIPTIIRKDGAEIWATYNPDDVSDYVHKRFVVGTDPNALVIEMNWRHNPWFNEAMNEERLAMKAANDDLYQHIWEGKCRNAAGKLFKRHWFKFYLPHEKPAALRPYAASDYAGAPDPEKPEREPDWNEHGTVGLDADGAWYFTDWWSGQEEPDIVHDAMVAQFKRHRQNAWFREKGVILRVTAGTTSRRLRTDKTYIPFIDLASAGSKAERAMGFMALCAAGLVHFPLNADGSMPAWVERCINQLCAFTGQDGRTDDMVDVCSLLARGIAWMRDATKPEGDAGAPEIKVGSRRHVESRYQDDEDDDDLTRRRRHYG